MFKKEITIHEFAEDKDIQELIKLGFMQIDNSKYEYNSNCYCKKCKQYRKSNKFKTHIMYSKIRIKPF